MSILFWKTLLATRTPRDYEQAVILSAILGILASLSFALLFWQWLAARRFPLHARLGDRSFAPAVTVFKPLKGSDAHTEKCLRSWFAQEYSGPVQILLGVHSPEDSSVPVIKKLLAEFPNREAQLVLTCEELGTNGKVSNLAQLVKHAKHDVFVISDADVFVPSDFLANAIAPLEAGKDAFHRVPLFDREVTDVVERVPTGQAVGLVNCFYRLANPTTLAMQWEAVAVNADFWSQVLQSKSLKPLDFALGAAMITRRENLEEIGGFESLVNCLADDYQLGHRIAGKSHRIALCPVVVECWDPPQTWTSVWKHQLRWARTVRVCQPAPYFFSILSNVTLWSLLWLLSVSPQLVFRFGLAFGPERYEGNFNFNFPWGLMLPAGFTLARIFIAFDLQRRLTRSSKHRAYFWLAPVKDLLQFALWLGAFAGNTVEWRGQRLELRKDGTLVKVKP